MKKLFTLFAAVASFFAVNAAQVTWKVSEMPDVANNDLIGGKTFTINSNLTVTFENGECKEGQEVKYRKVSAMPEPGVALYSKNEMTIFAEEATITSVQFIILTEESAGSDATPGWKVKAGNLTLSAEDGDTWTGSTDELFVLSNSKSTLVGLVIDYTPEDGGSTDEPGQEGSIDWSVGSLELANNDLIGGRSFDINSNLAVSFADGDCKEGQEVKYRKVTAMPSPGIALYSKNIMTITATDATITSVKFNVLTDSSAGSDATAGWKVKANDVTLSAEDGDTWTGSATEVTVVSTSKTTILGLVIEYATSDPGTGDDDEDNPSEFETAALFFGPELVGKGEAVQNVTLSDNGASVTFTTNSASAEIDENFWYYGIASEYDAIQYRFRPGGRSTNGENSSNKGVFTFPCSGTLYIYAFNNQDEDRPLELIQNGETVYNHLYKSTEYDAVVKDEETTLKVWPVFNCEVSKGKATLIWPVNQVALSGFEFVPTGGTPSGVDSFNAVEVANPQAYDLFGRPVSDDYKGIVIQGGKKFIRN